MRSCTERRAFGVLERIFGANQKFRPTSAGVETEVMLDNKDPLVAKIQDLTLRTFKVSSA